MLLWMLVLCRARTGSGKAKPAAKQGKGHPAPLPDPQTNRGLFCNMQVKEHDTQWVKKTQCSLAELRKPALRRVEPSWYRTGLHSRACLLPSRFLVPNLLSHSYLLSLAYSPSSQTGAAPGGGPIAGQRKAWLQGAEGYQAGTDVWSCTVGGWRGNRASCPAVGMRQSASKALRTAWHCFSSPLRLCSSSPRETGKGLLVKQMLQVLGTDHP